jgi:hypothetical protein
VNDAAEKRALGSCPGPLTKRGMARFEVLGVDADRDLIRTFARRLAENDAEAARLRAEVRRSVGEPMRTGGVLAALRRSPLVGADLDLARPFEPERKIDL